jgi:hypothetical protein
MNSESQKYEPQEPPKAEFKEENLIQQSETEGRPLEFEIPTDIASTEQVSRRVREATEKIDKIIIDIAELIERNDIDTPGAELAVNEVLVNGVFHGNWKVSKTGLKDVRLDQLALEQLKTRLEHGITIGGKVSTAVEITPKAMVITVEDEGDGFDHEKKRAELADFPEEKRLEESGRGLGLVYHVIGFNNVKFENGGRKVILTLPRLNS